MTVLLGLALATQVVVVALFLHHIRESSRANDLRISGLLNRIQAPETTVAQELVKADEYEPVVLPHTEASYWADVEHKDVD